LAKQLIITEKPSVAQDIAGALGGFDLGDDFHESGDFVVTWALGHLVALAEPKVYNPDWARWAIKDLPIIPEGQYQLEPLRGQATRLSLIRKLGRRKDVAGLINACDAGREGQLIFDRIVEYTKLTEMQQDRLWLQSMTKDAIIKGFDSLNPDKVPVGLSHAAWLRSVGDWLVGINATRALTRRLNGGNNSGGAWSAGRVQTPTLNLLVEREHEILAHIPRPYWELSATFGALDDQGNAQEWTAKFRDESLAKKGDREATAQRLYDGERAAALQREVPLAKNAVVAETRKVSKEKPKGLFDLTLLQREANKRYKMSARRTLQSAQRLYAQYKLITYPRTEYAHLPEDYGPKVHEVLGALAEASKDAHVGPLASVSADVLSSGPQNMGKLLNDSKVGDHFAIIPTGGKATRKLGDDDARIYELVVRRFIAAFMGPATWAVVERNAEVDVPSEASPALFRITSKTLDIPGFYEALGLPKNSAVSLPPLVVGSNASDGIKAEVREANLDEKQTKPPARYSEAQLLRLMQTAGELIEDDEALSEAMKKSGLGTPATRADTIERLLHERTSYARRVTGTLAPTAKGIRLIDILHRVDGDKLVSPKLTGEWERTLNEVARGEQGRDTVYEGLVRTTEDLTEKVAHFEYDDLYKGEKPLGTCPHCKGDVYENIRGYSCEKNTRDSDCKFILWKDTYGRYLDRGLVKRVLEERGAKNVSGFVDAAGTKYFEADLALELDDEKGVWKLRVQSGDIGASEDEEIVARHWPCPEHEGSVIVETTHRYVTEKLLTGDVKRGPVLPRVICKREIRLEEAAGYFTEEGKTPMLEDFTSKRGSSFNARLFRKPTGKHGFDFLSDEDEDEVARHWPCPTHEGAVIVETNLRFVSEKLFTKEATRGPVLPKVICKREITAAEAEAYFAKAGKTDLLDGFVSKRGNTFKAQIYRKKTGKHGFEFAPREGAPKKKKPAKRKTTKATKKT